MSVALPTTVQLREVGPRDGFQNEPEIIETADKVRLIEALGRTVSAFSQFVAAHPEISEAELNPVIALPDSCVAVDARIVVV